MRAMGVWSLLPPVVAIVVALAFREVLVALFAGVWVGALLIADFDPLAATLRSIDHYAIRAAADEDHAMILVFSLLLGGMVGAMTRGGGAKGLAEWVTRRATSRRSALLSTWGLGILVFFDDYANSLLVGSSMRPVTDRLRISREKLAFLVDATAAPVASIAIVSSWIGVEVGYIADQLSGAGVEADGYLTFLETLSHRFYPWLMLLFGLLVAFSGKDFGPMRTAEARARGGKLLRDGARPASDFEEGLGDEGVPPRIMQALVPIVVVIGVALLGMITTGWAACAADEVEPTLRNIFGNANSMKALLWASAAGGVVGVAGAVPVLGFRDSIHAWVKGLQAMLLACVILVLAWALGAVCKDLETANYVVQAVGPDVPVGLLPTLVFVVAAGVSFATGTSWGTMAILFPLVVPLAVELSGVTGSDPLGPVVLGAIAAILSGAVWGDHCSPISDTTVMSSMATSCDHTDHVRTQLPYALSVGLVSIVLGEIPVGMGWYPASVGLLLGALAIGALFWFLPNTDQGPSEPDDASPAPEVAPEAEQAAEPEAF